MFTFFHKKEKITLDVFTCDTVAYNCSPVVKATKMIPDWWKELPIPSIGDAFNNMDCGPIQTNMKRCFGFFELFKKSFIVSMAYDLHLKIINDVINYYTLGPAPQFHQKSHYGDAFPNHKNIKITSPWLFHEKTGIYFAVFGAEWNLHKFNIKVLPGIDNYIIPQQGNINLMLQTNLKEEYNIYLKIGTPLYHIVPLTEKQVEIKCHLITSDEYKKLLYKPLKTFQKFDYLVKLAKKHKCAFNGE